MNKGVQKGVCLLLLLAIICTVTACSPDKREENSKEPAAQEQKMQEQSKTDDGEEVSEDSQVPDDGRFHCDFLITAEEAKDKVGQEDVLFVDTRGWKQAILGTVEGAVATTWQDLSTCEEGKAGDENWGKIPNADDFAKRLADLGITKDKEIIFLGETLDGWGDDARLLWQVRAAGYTNVKMVDGGLQAAKDAGIETQMFASKSVPGEVEIESIDMTHVMTTEDLKDDYNAYKIVDVRTDEEYNGEILYDEAQGGHLPGAVHIRYTDLFQEDGTLKPNKELIAMFEEAGLEKEDKIVAYCTGGIRSAYMQLVLEMCGYEYSYNYDQSFWRWAVVGDVE